jgi:hypothetical protein
MMATYAPRQCEVLPQQRGHQRKTPVVEINRGFYSRLAPHTIKNSGMEKPAFGDDAAPSAMILISVYRLMIIFLRFSLRSHILKRSRPLIRR